MDAYYRDHEVLCPFMAARRASGAADHDVGEMRDPALWVELAVDLDDEVDCPLAAATDPSARGKIQLVGDTCHLTLANDVDGRLTDVRTYTTSVDDRCVCPSFCEGGCVPEVLAVENGSLRVGAYADSRETLRSVMDRVREQAERVQLERLTSPKRDGSTGRSGWRREALENVSLTAKQREAVVAAVEMGYYDNPRSATLGDLADRLGVTRSALSQRLNAVETKLVTSLVGDL